MHPSSPAMGPICLLLLYCAWLPAHAEQQDVIEVVEVTAPNISSLAGGAIDAETYYDKEEIEALGASTLEELLEELSPDVTSVRGRRSGKPIVLVNGRRIASFAEIRSYPPESVKSIEVFPEEVALRYGYRADQKVVNIQLLPRFNAATARTDASSPSDSGGEALQVSADHLRIELDQRASFDLRAESQNEILESDRSVPVRSQGTPRSLAGNIGSPGGGEIDASLSALAGMPVTSATLPANAGNMPLTLEALLPTANNPVRTNVQNFRSLAPESKQLSGGASYSHPLGESLYATVSGSFEQTQEISYLGLPNYTLVVDPDSAFSPFSDAVVVNRLSDFSGPLKREQTQDSYALNANLAATYNRWTWSWITNLNLAERKTSTDRNQILVDLPADANPFGTLDESLRLDTNIQNTKSRDYETRFLANSTLAELPHGPLSAALSVGFTRNEQRNSNSSTLTNREDNRLTRNVYEVRSSIDLPLISSASFGEVSVNLNAEASLYSDFDQITVYGTGVNWRPNQTLQLVASYAIEEGAPGIAELGDPLLLTPNQNVYDFLNDESASATRISGGNPDLQPDKRNVWRVGAQFRPFSAHDFRLSVDWVDSDTDRPIDSFPSPSPEIEAAFPERFLRNDAGELLAFDTRPVNLDSERTNELRSGLRYLYPILQGSRSIAGDGQSAKRSGRGKRSGRLLVALNHTWALKDELRIAPGLESIDYIGRNTNGRRRGGSEHEITARLSYNNKGRGILLDAQWQSAISTLPDAEGNVDLNQSDLLTVNLSTFYFFRPDSELVGQFNWLKGLRMRLNIDNLFDEKPRVRDQNGLVTAGSSGDELDPFGRTLELELRKLF